MHFSKSYAQILLSLPPELRENAISYRQASPSLHRPSFFPDSNPPKLKKLVNQVVRELKFLGFSPEVVRDLVKQGDDILHAMRVEHNLNEQTEVVIQPHAATNPGLKLLYEVDNDLGHLVPRLRLIVDKNIDTDTAVSEAHTAMTRILTWDTKPYVPILASLGNSPTDS